MIFSFQEFIQITRNIYGDENIPLHRPVFRGKEKQYLIDCIDSNFVSSIGAKVTEFEHLLSEFTDAGYAVATVNGTAALHVALKLAGVLRGDEVISQALTFIATCNALSYTGAHPVFVDVDRDTMGMSPRALAKFLDEHAEIRKNQAWNKNTGKRLAACVPMHTFGLPCRIDEISAICDAWRIPLVEDAAESLGSFSKDRHTGTFGVMGALSFNGNKILTTGGGGMLITNDEALARRAKHITTTAKLPHPYEFVHDEVGFNYRLPNLNAALGCAQMECLPLMLEAKRHVAEKYKAFFEPLGVPLVQPLPGCISNHWLNAIILGDKSERDAFLAYTNDHGVMTRPIWRLMSDLEMFKHCQHDGLENSHWLEERVVNIPSSVPDSYISGLAS